MAGTQELVTAITATWSAIQQHHEDVPDVMFTIGQGAARKTQRLGHFLAGGWVGREDDTADIHEVFIGAEGLAEGADELLGTLLHEATHALAHARQISDTSRQGRYHNARFRDLAEELGLRCSLGPKDHGWTVTEVEDATRRRYARQIQRLDTAISGHRRTRRSRPSNNNGLSLTCGCGRKIRVAESTADRGPILCGLCDRPFV